MQRIRERVLGPPHRLPGVTARYRCATEAEMRGCRPGRMAASVSGASGGKTGISIELYMA